MQFKQGRITLQQLLAHRLKGFRELLKTTLQVTALLTEMQGATQTRDQAGQALLGRPPTAEVPFSTLETQAEAFSLR